jgi:hypothetical protein
MRALSAVVLLVYAVAADAQSVDKAALARTAAGDASSTLDKVHSVVAWANRSFKWTYTDNKYRTVDEIIARQGGNCWEQTTVVRALLKELGIRTRSVREINIQPDSRMRQWSAGRKVAKNGNRSSVYGRRHNDHVWMEFWDDAAREWTPADPALNLVGLESWLKSRVGFSARPMHEILKSRDMLVPIAVFAEQDSALESRSAHYLLAGFDAVYGGRLQNMAAWPDWNAAISALEPATRGAFEGKINLHLHNDEILKAKVAYRALQSQFAAGK